MINVANKTIAFFMYLFASFISWVVLIVNIFLQFITIFQMPTGVDILGFLIVTVFLSIYTLSLMFKMTNTSFAPIIFALLHLITLHSGVTLVILLIIDLVVLYLLNTTQPQINDNYHRETHQTHNYQNYQYDGGEEHHLHDDNVFEAEYTTKKDEE